VSKEDELRDESIPATSDSPSPKPDDNEATTIVS